METFTKAKSFLEDQQVKYQCDICNKTFSRVTNLRSHFNSHKMPPKLQVETKKPFPPKAKKGQIVASTEAQVAMDAKNWNNFCKICRQEFKRHQEFRIHIKTHTGLE